ncbi:MAG: SIS domain-containing protein [Alphaproteobacteria bacterium]
MEQLEAQQLENIKFLVKRNIDAKNKLLEQNIIPSQIYNLANIFADTFKNGGKLLFCGNGGSAADAQHLAAEFLIRFRKDVVRPPLPAIALHLDASSITACGNDYDFESYYSRLVEALGSKNDCLIGISTSGNSKNILDAIKKAKEKGLKTAAFLGCDGGEIAKFCDYPIIVDEKITAVIQEIHIMVGHALVETTENIMIKKNYFNH